MKIIIDREPRYYRWEQDREYFRPGETVSGRVEFDPPGRRPPPGTRVLWTDSSGRVVRSQPGVWNSKQGFLSFEFVTHPRVAMANYIEVETAGRRTGKERFVITRPQASWDDYHVFVWAHYPYGYYDKLLELGVDGEIAYKRESHEHIIENNFLCYVDQVSPDELSAYHRPYWMFWEAPEKLTYPRRQNRWFQLCWDMTRQRYKRARARLGAGSVALDPEGVKTLWRGLCPSDRGIQSKMRERIMNTVIQHKNVRPMFYNLADEPGTGDQGAPFDFCFCKHCLDRFRTWLERKYVTLANLNRQWDSDFILWRQVIPRTTDDTLRRQAAKKDFNLASWSDHREFMDDVITGAYGLMREFGREADPNALYATTGGQGPLAHGGFDFAKIAKNVDLHVPYNCFNNDEMLRSFRPRILKMAPYFGNDPGLLRRMWYQLFHGDCGQIHWDNDEPKGRFLKRPGAKVTPRGRMMGPLLRELTGGTGKQIMMMKPVSELLAVHHSQSSVRSNWFMGTIAEGHAWVDRDSGNTENLKDDAMFHTRDSVVKLIGDSGLQYRFVAYDAVARGELQNDGLKAFFMPHSMAVSPEECAQIRRFAEGGGVVIADTLPAVMDGSCRMLPAGQLDDLFGVRRKGFVYNKPGAAVTVVEAGGVLGLKKGRLAVKACEPGIRAVRGAVAHGKASSADCLIVRRVGRGLAIYLNVRLRGYYLDRYALKSAVRRDQLALFQACLAAAGIVREINITEVKSRTSLPGMDVTRFADGPVEMVGAVVCPNRATSGVGEESKVDMHSFDKAADACVEFPRDSHMYDARRGKYLGYGRRFEDHFDPMDAKLYSMLPYRVQSVSASVRGKVRTGADAGFAIRLGTEDGTGTGRHVVRCDVYDGRGKWYPHYSANVVVDGGRGEFVIPFAESDRRGGWSLALRDVVTGLRCRFSFRLV